MCVKKGSKINIALTIIMTSLLFNQFTILMEETIKPLIDPCNDSSTIYFSVI